jgi:fatty acid desaturase
LHVSTPRAVASAAHLAVAWSLYAALGMLALRSSSMWVRLPSWFVMAWILVGNGATVHETLHGHLFRSRRANRVAGVVAGASVGLPFSVYRSYHLGHHQYSCTADDPEGPPYRFTSKLYYLLIPIGGPLFAVQFVWWTLQSLAGRPPVFVRSDRQRRAVVVDGLLGIAFYAAMATLGMYDVGLLVSLWLAPWLMAVVLLEPFVLIPEHYGALEADAASALRTTRTVRSNPLVSWVYWCNNLHTAHHIAPGVVPQEIAAVSSELVEPCLADEWRATGYLAFHWRLLRQLPWLPR